jgi:hypothetical protein
MDPFIYASGYNPHTTYKWASGGIQVEEVGGCHAMFAARVPFIPSFLSDDFTRMVTGEMGRIKLIVSRQIRFINDLARAQDFAATFDLRFISRPKNILGSGGADEPRSDIDIVFFGKAFYSNRQTAIDLAKGLWQKFYAHFPLEDPFNYPLLPIVDADDFHNCLSPVPLDDVNTEQVVEIRKFEEHDPYTSEAVLLGYHPHQFMPVFDFSAMGRFLEVLARQSQPCVVSISLQPTRLFKEESQSILQMLATYENIQRENEGWMNLHRQERLEDLRNAYWPIINQRYHLFSIRIQVWGESRAPHDLVEALGSEIMNNTTAEPRLWSAIVPNEDEWYVARDNLRLLEHKIWQPSMIDPRGSRLRFLVTAYEAAGAFRLPIPPESGYMPGIVIKDEPFVQPSEPGLVVTEEQKLAAASPKVVPLGEIIHRGTPTGIQFNLSVEDLKRHALIAGATGSGKTNTCLHVLSRLWVDYGIPFLVLYPIDKPDYRLLMADSEVRERLLIFTLGDETVAPFRFNPFYVPPGILLKTHLSLLMRSFMAAFTMWDPLPAVYREALRKVYKDRGWDLESGKGGDPNLAYPTMSDFYKAIVEVANRLTKEYGSEAKGNVRQASEIRIRDLLNNTSSVINVQEQAPLSDILSRPTVMELGRIGSSEDIALVMGFLLTALMEQLQSEQKDIPQDKRDRLHITLVEEAHRLMSAGSFGSEHQADARAQGGEDFSNILAEVRGFGEGILIAEQIPTNLVQGAIGNTHVKIAHWLEDAASFNLFGDILNLNDPQREYARTLGVGQAIMRSKSGRPVHIKVKNYLDRFQRDVTDAPVIDFELADGTRIRDDTDASVRAFMRNRMKMPARVVWEPEERAFRKWGELACAFCKVPCQYGEQMGSVPVVRADAIGKAAQAQEWKTLHRLCTEAIRQAGIRETDGAAYCYLAKLATSKARDGRQNLEVYDHVRAALYMFHQSGGA